MTDDQISQKAWELGFKDEDLIRLYKIAGLIRADAFGSGFESGMRFQKQITLNILKKATDEISGKNESSRDKNIRRRIGDSL